MWLPMSKRPVRIWICTYQPDGMKWDNIEWGSVELLSVRRTEIKTNLPNMKGRRADTFDYCTMFATSLTFSKWWTPWKDKTRRIHCVPSCLKCGNLLLISPVPLSRPHHSLLLFLYADAFFSILSNFENVKSRAIGQSNICCPRYHLSFK